MQLSLRPYVTTGVALVGASVIAAAPLQPVLPADVQIPKPVATVARDVQLTGFVDDTVNQLLFSLIASPTVRISEALLVPIAELLGIDSELAASLPLASLGIVGPVISGGGATGLAVQNLIDALGDDNPLEAFTLAIINAPATIIDGIVNGGYGPDLASLVIPLLPALPATIPVGTVDITTGNPGCTPNGTTCLVLTVVPSYGTGIFAPGLLTPLADPTNTIVTPPTVTFPGGVPTVVPGALTITPTLPGTFPVLTNLTEALFGLLNPPEEMVVETAVVDENKNFSDFTSDEKKEAPANKGPIRELLGNVRDAVLPDSSDGPEVLPKKNRPLLNVLKLNPLDHTAKKDEKVGVSGLGSDSDAPGKHRIGTPVRDLIHKVLGGNDKKESNPPAPEGETE